MVSRRLFLQRRRPAYVLLVLNIIAYGHPLLFYRQLEFVRLYVCFFSFFYLKQFKTSSTDIFETLPHDVA